MPVWGAPISNLTVSIIHFKYWKNILIWQLHWRFSRFWSNSGYFGKVKNNRLQECKQIIHPFEARDLEDTITLGNFAKSVFAHIFAKLVTGISRSRALNDI